MVDLVYGFIERTPVECAVGEVVPSILEDEENRNLVHHLPDGWEGDTGCKSEILGQRVEEPIVMLN